LYLCSRFFKHERRINKTFTTTLATAGGTATICTDAGDHAVVTIAARMLADDVQRVTGRRPELSHKVTPAAALPGPGCK